MWHHYVYLALAQLGPAAQVGDTCWLLSLSFLDVYGFATACGAFCSFLILWIVLVKSDIYGEFALDLLGVHIKCL
jgi:hypothetical protein